MNDKNALSAAGGVAGSGLADGAFNVGAVSQKLGHGAESSKVEEPLKVDDRAEGTSNVEDLMIGSLHLLMIDPGRQNFKC
jgi:hypothetical protein